MTEAQEGEQDEENSDDDFQARYCSHHKYAYLVISITANTLLKPTNII